jgi:hypothetical protein
MNPKEKYFCDLKGKCAEEYGIGVMPFWSLDELEKKIMEAGFNLPPRPSFDESLPEKTPETPNLPDFKSMHIAKVRKEYENVYGEYPAHSMKKVELIEKINEFYNV